VSRILARHRIPPLALSDPMTGRVIRATNMRRSGRADPPKVLARDTTVKGADGVSAAPAGSCLGGPDPVPRDLTVHHAGPAQTVSALDCGSVLHRFPDPSRLTVLTQMMLSPREGNRFRSQHVRRRRA
jgi:hypothetical protein